MKIYAVCDCLRIVDPDTGRSVGKFETTPIELQSDNPIILMWVHDSCANEYNQEYLQSMIVPTKQIEPSDEEIENAIGKSIDKLMEKNKQCEILRE